MTWRTWRPHSPVFRRWRAPPACCSRIEAMALSILAIDGPSGSGKGTVSRLIARRTGWHLLDSGALYRLVGLAGSLEGLPQDDIAGHTRIADRLQVRFGSGEREQIELDGRDVTAEIRSEVAGAGA